MLALGSLAAQAVLGLQNDLEALRGKVHAMRSEADQDIPVVVTYHPTALLLRPQHKPDAWRDLNLARTLLAVGRSDEHTSELQSLMRISYAVFCLKNKNAPT